MGEDHALWVACATAEPQQCSAACQLPEQQSSARGILEELGTFAGPAKPLAARLACPRNATAGARMLQLSALLDCSAGRWPALTAELGQVARLVPWLSKASVRGSHLSCHWYT